MKKIFTSFYLVLSLLAATQAIGQEKVIKKVPRPGTGSIDGKALYSEFCAVCHGKDGHGNGPAATALKVPPTDLTQMAHRNGGRFSDQKVMAILNGEAGTGPHGNRDMPVWGKAFDEMSSLSVAQGRKHALVSYLEQMQAK